MWWIFISSPSEGPRSHLTHKKNWMSASGGRSSENDRAKPYDDGQQTADNRGWCGEISGYSRDFYAHYCLATEFNANSTEFDTGVPEFDATAPEFNKIGLKWRKKGTKEPDHVTKRRYPWNRWNHGRKGVYGREIAVDTKLQVAEQAVSRVSQVCFYVRPYYIYYRRVFWILIFLFSFLNIYMCTVLRFD